MPFCAAVWRVVALLLCACAIEAAFAATGQALLVQASNGNVSSFSRGVTANNATFAAVRGGYGSDKQAFGAQYPGTSGSGTPHGALAVSWASGQNVAYGAAFRLPYGFHSAPQGQQLLLGWSSPPGADGSVQQGGVVIDYSDDLGYLVTNTRSAGSVTQQVLAGPFALPIGRWFTLQVRQLLASAAPAQSGVYVNGRLVASSTAADFSGQQINEVDYGIVQLTGGAEIGSTSLQLDRAFAAVYMGYVNPLRGDRYISGRTDMGVDFCLQQGEPIRALGDGIVVGISPRWFKGQPYIWYQLLDGPSAGRFVYVAEQIDKLARVGTPLTAGQTIAKYKSAGTCIETGWSARDGATMAQATTGYHEGQVTKAGVSFARFLMSLGVRGGFELKPTHGMLIRSRRVSRPSQDPWAQGP
jgi:hypothetical protein